MIWSFTAHTIKWLCHSIRSMFRVLGMYNFALCLDGCESHGLSTTKLTYSYTVRQPPPSMHSARSGTIRNIWFKILIFFQVQIFWEIHKKTLRASIPLLGWIWKPWAFYYEVDILLYRPPTTTINAQCTQWDDHNYLVQNLNFLTFTACF